MGKKLNLSKEEVLAQALVPESEWSYKVPGNWVWVRLGAVVSVSKDKKDQFDEEGLKYVGLEHIESDCGLVGFSAASSIRSLKNVFRRGDILYGKLRPYLNKHDIAPFDGVCSTDILVLKPTNLTNAEYVNHLLGTSELLEFAVNNSKGINLPRVSENVLLSFPAPLPPLAEQQRIVDRIESLFEKLDQAKGLIQEALDSFENRRAAILHKAFSGELTKKWREENGVGMESWERKHLGSACKSIFDGDHMPPPKSENGVPFLVISNVNKGFLTFDNTRFVPQSYYDNLSETRKPQMGDLLYTTVGSYGIPVIVDTNRAFCFQRHMALIKPDEINTRFLWYLLQTSNIYEQVTNIATGTAQLTVPIKGLRQIEIILPGREEQSEIVRVLDKLFENELNAKILINNLLEVDLLKKSILARAFRSELGTNDPNDESAISFLTYPAHRAHFSEY